VFNPLNIRYTTHFDQNKRSCFGVFRPSASGCAKQRILIGNPGAKNGHFCHRASALKQPLERCGGATARRCDACSGLVGGPDYSRSPSRGFFSRDGNAGRRCAGEGRPDNAARPVRMRFRAAPDFASHPKGAGFESRQQDRGMAIRSAHPRLCWAAGDGPSRESAIDDGSHHGARFRSRHHGSAHVDLDGLHRKRAGRDGGRRGVSGSGCRIQLVGGDLVGRRLERHALAAARECHLA
jgi:hypothetical protein